MSTSSVEARLATHIRACGLPEPQREYVAFPPRRYRFDFAWPDQKIAVEVDGGIRARTCRTCRGTGLGSAQRGRCPSCYGSGVAAGKHTRKKGIEADCEKALLAFEDGWRVLRVTPQLVLDGRAVRALEAVLGAKS